MSKLLDILLQRNESNIPWGFSIEGGFDRNIAPFVSSVRFGTLASQYLNAGDRVLQIQHQPAGGLLQSEIEKFLNQDGRNLQLMIEKSTILPRQWFILQEPESPFLRSNLVFGRMRQEAIARQKRFLRMSESIIEDHFNWMKEFFNNSRIINR